MEEIARVYANALFESGKGSGKLDPLQEQLDQFTEALDQSRDMQVFFFSPYFSSAEKSEGIGKVVSGAEPEFVNFLELLVEKHRMPALFRIRRRFDALCAEENQELEVTVTSAVELDQGTVDHIGDAIAKQTGRKIDLDSTVDDSILGGLVLRVGNMVLDASVRNQLEKLRKNVATAA
jgi:F-type H+-transporting ATPase subunit delta